MKNTGASLYEEGKRLPPPTPFSPKRKAVPVSVTPPNNGVPVMLHAEPGRPETEKAGGDRDPTGPGPYPPEAQQGGSPCAEAASEVPPRLVGPPPEAGGGGGPGAHVEPGGPQRCTAPSSVVLPSLHREVTVATVPSKGSSTHGSGKQGPQETARGLC